MTGLPGAVVCAVSLTAGTMAIARVVAGPGQLGRDRALAGATALAAIVWLDTQVAAIRGFDRRALAAVLVVAAAAAIARRLHRRVAAGDGVPEGGRRLRWLMALAVAGPLLWWPVPLDTDAQGFGQLALSVREGGSLATLAPWRPAIAYLYAPGALVAAARVSALMPWLPMSDVLLGLGHASALLFVAVAGTCGRELALAVAGVVEGGAGRARADAWHAAATLAAAASAGLWTALVDAHYTATLALAFTIAWLTWSLRAARTRDVRSVALAALAGAALALSHQDTAIIVALGAVPLAVAAVVAAPAADRIRVAGVVAAIAVLAAVLVSPWLASVQPLLATGVASPFERSPRHLLLMAGYHGVVWPAAALIALAARPRSPWTWALAAWLLLIADFAVTGVVARLLPGLVAPITRFAYPFSLAWHGPIVPFVLLGTIALAWIAARLSIDPRSWPAGRPAAFAAIGLAAAIAGLPWLASAARQAGLRWHGAFATANDVAALDWIRRETVPTARLLNYPGDYPNQRDWEGHWVPVLAERDAVYLRMQPFFVEGRALARARQEQRALLAFWRDPADPRHLPALRAARIAYVVVPEITQAGGGVWRGAPPALLPDVASRPADAAYLRRVFQRGGAEVYAVVEAGR
jgi:hypothetical protein